MYSSPGVTEHLGAGSMGEAEGPEATGNCYALHGQGSVSSAVSVPSAVSTVKGHRFLSSWRCEESLGKQP